MIEEVKEDNTPVQIANGSYISGEKNGIVKMSVSNRVSKNYITIENVLATKELSKNILSVSKLTEKGAEVNFSKTLASVTMHGVEVMRAVKKDCLYIISTDKNEKVNTALAQNKEAEESSKRVKYWKGGDINIWHQRLGHVSEDVVKKTIPISGNIKPCEECLESKFDRAPFNDQIKREASPLERIYSDVCGPMEEDSFQGSKYFVSFIDGYSRYAKVFTIRSKSEVFDCFKDFCTSVENSTGKKIKSIRSDNGGEYNNGSMKGYCRSNGIRMEFTTPYTSQQNGIAERYNRSIMNMTRAMLKKAKLDKKYWAEALITAVYLKNVVATRVLEWKTPYECWNMKKPKLEYLRTFGSVAYVRIPEQLRQKLDARGKKVILLGYDTSLKNYRLLDLENNSVIRSRDVNVLDTEPENSEDNYWEYEAKEKPKEISPMIDDVMPKSSNENIGDTKQE